MANNMIAVNNLTPQRPWWEEDIMNVLAAAQNNPSLVGLETPGQIDRVLEGRPAQGWLGRTAGDIGEFLEGINWGKVGGGAAIGAGLLGLGKAYGATDIDFTPQFTPTSARKMIGGAKRMAFQGIERGVQRERGRVASQYVARGLGTAGAPIGDIADIGVGGVRAKADVETQLNEQLLNLLRYIEQRDLAVAQQESARKQGFWSDIADVGLTLGGMLLAPATGGASVPVS